MKGRTVFITSFAVIAIVAIFYIGSQFAEQNYKFHGSLFDPFQDAYPFELTDHNGNLFRMADQRGKVVLLFFGYTNCPDVCPATMSDFNLIHGLLGEQVDKVVFLLVTVDPERDTSEKLGEYVTSFNTAFIGLSGTPEELQAVWDGYYIFQEKEEGLDGHDGEGAGYLVSHTARIYVVDTEGKLRLTFPSDISNLDMASDVEYLANE